MDGNRAMGFARYRHANKGGGDSDLVRIERQQQLFSAMKSKLTNPSVFFKVPGILDGIRDDTETNLSNAQMLCLARFVRSLPKDKGINMATIPMGKGSRIYVKADPNATRDLVDRMFTSTP